MKKILKNIEIIEILNGITDMREREKNSMDAKLPIKVNFALNKNFQRLMKEAEPYEEARKEVIEKYNNPRAKKGTVDILPGWKKKYDAEMKELFEIENEVEIHMIRFSEVEKCNNLLIADLAAMDFMILGDEEPENE